MSAYVTVGGTEFDVDRRSFSMGQRVGERSTASMVLWDTDGTRGDIEPGMPVKVYGPDGTTVVFDGYVALPILTRMNPDDPLLRWQVDAVDFHYLADRRVVADAWSSTAAGTIVGEIITNVLAAEGITAGTIDAGPTLSEVVFAYVTCDRALNALAEATNHTWWIDTAKALHFQPATTPGTPAVTIDRDDLRAAPVLRNEPPDYRNRQYVRGAQAFTDPQVESMKGDGESRTFVVGYPVGQVPTVKVNTVAGTVGIRGVDTGVDWYWSKGSNEISQDSGDTPLGSTDTLEVTYVGMYDIVTLANDFGEQSRVAGVEGSGTGRVEAVLNVSEVFGRQAALEVATGVLDTFARKGCELQVLTGLDTIDVGDWVTVNLPELGLSNEVFLALGYTAADLTRTEWEYDYTLVQGAIAASWQARMSAGLRPAEPLSIFENLSESETVLILQQFAEAWGAWGESVTPTVNACPVPSTTTYPTTSLYPC